MAGHSHGCIQSPGRSVLLSHETRGASGFLATTVCVRDRAWRRPVGLVDRPLGRSASRLRSWHFDVLLDGKSIGRHDFTVEDSTNSIDVIGHARFDVRFAGFVVYQYEHWDHEGWSDGCLSRIDARTNDAGRTSRVQGELSGATFALRSDGASSALPRCVHADAYWNLQLLRQEHLLNPQTGPVIPCISKSLVSKQCGCPVAQSAACTTHSKDPHSGSNCGIPRPETGSHFRPARDKDD